jgi:hypothetical protein
MANQERTTIAVLGTLAEFHREPIPFDLAALLRLVMGINPDFLCLDMTPQQWHDKAFADLPPEYSETLLPLAQRTDMVVVPVGDEQPLPPPPLTGRRATLLALLRRLLAALQRSSPGPDAINQGVRHFFADGAYFFIDLLEGQGRRLRQQQHVAAIARRVSEVARRDPGRRILVVLNVQYCHHVRQELGQLPDIEVVDYNAL